MIDNLDRNHKLGLVFETRVGPGKLLICACDLLKLPDDPASPPIAEQPAELRCLGSISTVAEFPADWLQGSPSAGESCWRVVGVALPLLRLALASLWLLLANSIARPYCYSAITPGIAVFQPIRAVNRQAVGRQRVLQRMIRGPHRIFLLRVDLHAGLVALGFSRSDSGKIAPGWPGRRRRVSGRTPPERR